jgi:hypothetical protein
LLSVLIEPVTNIVTARPARIMVSRSGLGAEESAQSDEFPERTAKQQDRIVSGNAQS